MDSQLRNGCRVIILAIVLYGIVAILRESYNERFLDPEEYPFAWPLWHFIVMFMLGYISPRYWYLFLFLSIAWEIVEYFYDKTDNFPKIYNPHDYLWNSLGLLAGVYASKHSRINLMKDIKGLIKPQTK